ncbi:MAG TPA: PIG-L family deacetylase [Herpetosiphonaceae bacterium]
MTEATLPRRRRVLVVVAHPDDAEFMCGGTLARWHREGHEISYCLITDGNHGSSDPEMTTERLAAIRQDEQRAASAVFGAEDVTFLHFVDAELEPTLAVRKAITREIRRHRPHVVLCQDPMMFYSDTYANHPDHRAAGEASLAAIMPSASTRLIYPELLADKLEPYNVSEIYLMGTGNADTWVPLEEQDILKKVESLRCHVSQIGTKWDVEARMREWGEMGGKRATEAGVEATYAEGFKRIKLRNLDETLAQEAEADAMES